MLDSLPATTRPIYPGFGLARGSAGFGSLTFGSPWLGDMLSISVDGDADAVTARIRSGWFKFRSVASFLTFKNVSVLFCGKVWCMSMLHRSKTWTLKRENELALQRTEMRMIRFMCGVKWRRKLFCVELRQRLEIEDIVKVVQILQWYGHVLRTDGGDWVTKCFILEIEGARQRGGPGKHGKRLCTGMWMICT